MFPAQVEGINKKANPNPNPNPNPDPNPNPNPNPNPHQVEGINKKEVRKYRQYMNRRGGFNRPLEEGGGAGF